MRKNPFKGTTLPTGQKYEFKIVGSVDDDDDDVGKVFRGGNMIGVITFNERNSVLIAWDDSDKEIFGLHPENQSLVSAILNKDKVEFAQPMPATKPKVIRVDEPLFFERFC